MDSLFVAFCGLVQVFQDRVHFLFPQEEDGNADIDGDHDKAGDAELIDLPGCRGLAAK